MPSVRHAHAALVLSTLLVATSFPVVAAIAGALDSLVLTWLRFVVASLLFLPLVLRRHGARVWPSGRALLGFALLSLPLVAFFAAMFEALRTTSPLNTGALFTLAPGFATLAVVLLGGPRPGRRLLAGLAVGLAGALWVVFRGDPARLLALRLVPGDLLYLAGTAALGLYSALIPRLRGGAPPEVMTFWTLVTGAGWLTLMTGGSLAATTLAALTPEVLGALVYLALFTTLATFLLSQAGTLRLGPTRGMAYTYLTPTLVGLLAWWLEGEPLGWSTLPGVLLTLVAMAVLLPDPAPAVPSAFLLPDRRRPRRAASLPLDLHPSRSS